MKYLIDNKLIFDSENNTLSNLDENHCTEDVLPRPTSRLLCELVKQQGSLIERNKLLKLVWSDYGSIPSDSNLNNHLTILRKRLDDWGVNRNKIETIPRKGVKLTADVIVMSTEINSDDKFDYHEPAILQGYITPLPPLGTADPDPQKPVLWTSPSFRKGFFLTGCLLSTVSAY
ncbi:winged helix-turn-helix domain-containing protein [Serratia quinivorans]|uniref:winged helix-turn-helix domain-containing protein n=1 Tax=Serratia quinivorans TaxID=137545 RepID=UPI0039828457